MSVTQNQASISHTGVFINIIAYIDMTMSIDKTMSLKSMEKSVESIATELRKSNNVFEKYGIKFTYLAGSVVRGEAQWWSDIDIFVAKPSFETMSGDAKYQFLSQINGDMSRVTGLDELEIRVIETLPLRIQFNVIKEGILVFEGDRDYLYDFKTKILKYYGDFKIWMERYYKIKKEYRDENR